MRRTIEKIKTQIHLVMTDSETLAYPHCKHLLVDTFIGLFAMVDLPQLRTINIALREYCWLKQGQYI